LFNVLHEKSVLKRRQAVRLDATQSVIRPTKHREFASAILVDTRDRLLFQERDNLAGIIQPGKISLFGGHREDNETYLECVAREVHEEIGYLLPRQRFEHLTSYDGKDIDRESGTVHGEFFVVRDIPTDRLTISEGKLFIAELATITSLEHRLSPTTKVAVESFLERYSPSRD
jgi:8-oxo-dGTP pyrophosphatase MutT (NUDIX family)